MHNLIFRYDSASFLLRSPRLISNTRPFNPSDAILIPCVFVIRVRPASLTANILGAISLYHSFFKKGSTAFLRLPFLLFVSRLFFPCYHKTNRSGIIVSHMQGWTITMQTVSIERTYDSHVESTIVWFISQESLYWKQRDEQTKACGNAKLATTTGLYFQ